MRNLIKILPLPLKNYNFCPWDLDDFCHEMKTGENACWMLGGIHSLIRRFRVPVFGILVHLKSKFPSFGWRKVYFWPPEKNTRSSGASAGLLKSSVFSSTFLPPLFGGKNLISNWVFKLHFLDKKGELMQSRKVDSKNFKYDHFSILLHQVAVILGY